MSEIPAIERALLEAAQRRYPRRRRTSARAGAGLLAVAALVALAWVLDPLASERADERPAPPSTAAPKSQPSAGFERQLSLLGVLRTPAAADGQLRDQFRDWDELRPRAGYARLLGKPAGGSAFVLVPVARYQPTMWPNDAATRFRPKWAPDGLCVMPRDNQRGPGVCGSTQDLLDGSLSGERAGQVFGVVPDGVVAVRPAPGMKRVPVQRNFYAYEYTPTRHAPAWCDRAGTCREVAPWWWCDRGGTCTDTGANG